MSTGYSPAWSPGSARLQLGAASRLRSSSLKKPPEPLHRAVADCLSSSSSTSCSIFSSLLHGSTSAAVSEASRTLRDYLASPTTTDLAYCVILEHTLAERERSPAVVGRCVALLKRYLLRYKPTEETLLQIDRFCVNTIAECGISPNKRLSPWLDQQSGGLAISHAFASGALVKSLNYVRSLVAPHILKRSFQPAAFAGVLPASRQSLPTLSALLSRSFNTHLSPSNVAEASEKIDASSLSISNLSTCKKANGIDDVEYIALDVLKWRWPVEKQSSLLLTESDHVVSPQIMNTHSFLEVGAAALLLGEADARVKGQEQRHLGIADMPYLDQLLQPLSVTTATDSSSAHHHLRAITASKRTRPGTQQVWEDANVSTYRPRARPLFQYRHYSEQQPLRLNNAEVCEVMTAVCSGISSPNANMATVSSRLSTKCGKLSMDVAVSVLIKLVIDMYVLDSAIAAPLTLSMLQDMITSPGLLSKVRAFDLILNLGVHAHLLEPVISDDTSTIEEDFCQESYFDSEAELATQEMRLTDSSKRIGSSAIHKFESWILGILYEVLLLLVQIEENEESVWASALSCLLYFVCYVGKIQRSKLKGLDIRVVMRLLEICRMNSWAEIVRCTLICMLTNMFYQTPDASLNVVSTSPTFLHDRVDLIGGIEFIFLEYSLSKSREERGNLYLVLFDYVLHLINETCIATGAPEFVDYEIQSIASLLTLADAPEAFYISIKLGVEGIGNILKGSICSALSRYPNSERLNMLLEKIIEKFNTIINSFTHLDKEFFQLMQKTKVCKFLGCIETMSSGNSECIQVKFSWATLHSLLHSERIACRQNGYIWLGDLLIAEISEESNERIWDNIKKLQQNIAIAGSAHESSVAADVPLPISVMCGLLKSKHNFIRWGFLFVLERLLVRCKCLLDEIEEHSSSSEALGHLNENGQLKKANAVIDMMSSAMSLVAQINETDHINILKMCDILFSQLCLKVPPAIMMPLEDVHKGKVSSCMDDDRKVDADDRLPQQEKWLKKEIMKEIDRKHGHNYDTFIVHDTASMAALLLGGQAVVPMQLVSRVPAALFYWPLIQLAGAATDNIALGVAVGSKGRGNLPGATSDIRAALLLLLIGKCTADPTAFQEVGGEEFFRELLDDTDSRVAYYSSAFLLKRMMTDEPEKYQRMLQSLIFKAQQTNNEKLLENPYLQMRGILQMSNVLGTGL